MSTSQCPDLRDLTDWLSRPIRARDARITRHVEACDACTAVVAAGAAGFVAADPAGANQSPWRTAAAVLLVIAVGGAFFLLKRPGRSDAAPGPVAAPKPAAADPAQPAVDATDPIPPVLPAQPGTSIFPPEDDAFDWSLPPAEWSREHLIAWTRSETRIGGDNDAVAILFRRCRDMRILEAIPKAVRIGRRSLHYPDGSVNPRTEAARALLDSCTEAEVRETLERLAPDATTLKTEYEQLRSRRGD